MARSAKTLKMYNDVNDLVAKEGITKEQAYERVAKQMGLKTGGVRGQYQRVLKEMRETGKAPAARKPARKAPAKRTSKAAATKPATKTAAKAKPAAKRATRKVTRTVTTTAKAAPTRRRRARRATTGAVQRSAADLVSYIHSLERENEQLKRKIGAANTRLAAAIKHLG